MERIINKIFETTLIDPVIKEFMLSDSDTFKDLPDSRYKQWELLPDPLLVIFEWNKLIKE